MLALMDGFAVAFIAALAVLLAIVAGVAISRDRELAGVRAALDGPGPRSVVTAPSDDASADAVRRLRRRAEAAELAEARRRSDLAYLADLVGVGIVRLSDELVVEVANAAAHVFLARTAGSMTGRTAIEAVGDHRVEAVARAARESGSATAEIALREPDGPVLVVRARRSPILGVWLVLEDVGELRRLQRIRAEFVDNLGHELRTPITTIGLLAETLARDVEAAGDRLPEKVRERVAKLETETVTIGQMVAELLDLARIEGGATQLLLDDVDLGAVATGAVERLRPFAERAGVTLEVTVAPDLPAIRGEAARLGQVVSNLVHNAVKFSPRGAGVRVGVEADGLTVVLRVADDGIGIAPADLPRVFERFFKADRSRSSGGGTGLGLAIVRHIVEGHGGTIEVTSIEGAGATFTVRIPVPDPFGT